MLSDEWELWHYMASMVWVSIAPVEGRHNGNRKRAHRQMNWARFVALFMNMEMKQLSLDQLRARRLAEQSELAGHNSSDDDVTTVLPKKPKKTKQSRQPDMTGHSQEHK